MWEVVVGRVVFGDGCFSLLCAALCSWAGLGLGSSGSERSRVRSNGGVCMAAAVRQAGLVFSGRSTTGGCVRWRAVDVGAYEVQDLA